MRRRLKLPRRARVASWELPDGARVDDPVAVATLRPLKAALLGALGLSALAIRNNRAEVEPSVAAVPRQATPAPAMAAAKPAPVTARALGAGGPRPPASGGWTAGLSAAGVG